MMAEILHLITSCYPSMKRAERAVAEYVLKNPDRVILLSMRGIAEQTGVSDNTVLRFCRSCGFSGFLDFKSALIPQLLKHGQDLQYSERDDSLAEQEKKTLSTILSTVSSTYEAVLPADIELVAAKLARSARVIVVGLGESSGIAHVLSTSLLTIGKYASTLSDKVVIERTCNTLDEDSVVVGFSHSGETEEVLTAVRRAREKGAFSVMVTNNMDVKRTLPADVFLFTHVPLTSITGYFFSLPRIAQLAVIELILSRVPSHFSHIESR